MNAIALGLVRSAACLCALGTVLTLGGCSQDSSDLVAYVDRVKARPGTPIKDTGIKLGGWKTFDYSQTRDPFESFIKPDLRTTQRTDPPHPPWPGHNPEELESFALDSLRMVGTLRQEDTYWGLIRSPDGVLHRVQIGNFVGKNYGKIHDIGESQIVLSEKISDGEGRWMDRSASMSLVQ